MLLLMTRTLEAINGVDLHRREGRRAQLPQQRHLPVVGRDDPHVDRPHTRLHEPRQMRQDHLLVWVKFHTTACMGWSAVAANSAATS